MKLFLIVLTQNLVTKYLLHRFLLQIYYTIDLLYDKSLSLGTF